MADRYTVSNMQSGYRIFDNITNRYVTDTMNAEDAERVARLLSKAEDVLKTAIVCGAKNIKLAEALGRLTGALDEFGAMD